MLTIRLMVTLVPGEK